MWKTIILKLGNEAVAFRWTDCKRPRDAGEEGRRERAALHSGINIPPDLEIMFLGLKTKFKTKNC